MKKFIDCSMRSDRSLDTFLILGTRFSILGTRIGSLKHLKKTLAKGVVIYCEHCFCHRVSKTLSAVWKVRIFCTMWVFLSFGISRVVSPVLCSYLASAVRMFTLLQASSESFTHEANLLCATCDHICASVWR